MGKFKPGLQMVEKEWDDLKPGECTFWRHDERAVWSSRKTDIHVTALIVACPKCGEPAEVSSDYGIVNWGKEQIHIICPLNCPGDGCHAKYYCRVGRFEFIRRRSA